jgi:hypothetical protein
MRRLRGLSQRGFGRAVSPIAGGQKQEPDVGTRPLEDIVKGIDGVEHNVIATPAQTHRTLRAAAMDTWRTASAAEISSVASQTKVVSFLQNSMSRRCCSVVTSSRTMPRTSEIQPITATTIWMAVEQADDDADNAGEENERLVLDEVRHQVGEGVFPHGQDCTEDSQIQPTILAVVGKCIYDFILRKIAELDEFDYPI